MFEEIVTKDEVKFNDLEKKIFKIEYRNMGTQESQIFSKLKKRFCSGRKAFCEHGANALAKVCVLSEKFSIDDIEDQIPIDTSVEDWIKEIEENVKRNKKTKSSYLATKHHKGSIAVHTVNDIPKFMKEINRMLSFSEIKLMPYSY